MLTEYVRDAIIVCRRAAASTLGVEIRTRQIHLPIEVDLAIKEIAMDSGRCWDDVVLSILQTAIEP